MNELITATKGTSSRLINAQDLSEEEIRLLHNSYCALAELAKRDSDLGQTHSVEEAGDNESEKAEARAGDAAQ